MEIKRNEILKNLDGNFDDFIRENYTFEEPSLSFDEIREKLTVKTKISRRYYYFKIAALFLFFLLALVLLFSVYQKREYIKKIDESYATVLKGVQKENPFDGRDILEGLDSSNPFLVDKQFFREFKK